MSNFPIPNPQSHPHRIRLRHPWRRDTSAGRIDWWRHFNCPHGLSASHRVSLVLEDFVDGPMRLSLNERPLGMVAGDGPGG